MRSAKSIKYTSHPSKARLSECQSLQLNCSGPAACTMRVIHRTKHRMATTATPCSLESDKVFQKSALYSIRPASWFRKHLGSLRSGFPQYCLQRHASFPHEKRTCNCCRSIVSAVAILDVPLSITTCLHVYASGMERKE